MKAEEFKNRPRGPKTVDGPNSSSGGKLSSFEGIASAGSVDKEKRQPDQEGEDVVKPDEPL